VTVGTSAKIWTKASRGGRVRFAETNTPQLDFIETSVALSQGAKCCREDLLEEQESAENTLVF
jgi:hypothetical protein